MTLVLPDPRDEGAPGIPYIGRRPDKVQVSYEKPDKYYYDKLKVYKRTGITFDKMADEPDYIRSDMDMEEN